MSAAFASIEDFGPQEELQELVPFCDLPLNTPMHLTDLHTGRTKYGQRWFGVLYLPDRTAFPVCFPETFEAKMRRYDIDITSERRIFFLRWPTMELAARDGEPRKLHQYALKQSAE